MVIEFACPRCKHTIHSQEGQEGQKLECPGCGAKVRVPAAPPPKAAPQAPAIQFASADLNQFELQCPRCRTHFLVNVADIGKKGRCPSCDAKIRIPDAPPKPTATPPRPPSESSERSLVMTSPPAAAPDTAASGELALPAEWAASTPAPLKRARSGGGGGALVALAVPFCTIGVLAAFVYYFVLAPARVLDHQIAGTSIESFDGKTVLDRALANSTPRSWIKLAECLHTEPLVLGGDVVEMTFMGERSAVLVSVTRGEAFQIVRIDPASIPAVKLWKKEHLDDLEKYRRRLLQTSLPQFSADLERRCKDNKTDLRKYRNPVGLTSLVQGFGLILESSTQAESFPCVYEDEFGLLYFTVPKGVSEFMVRSRQIENGPETFPGKLTVRVTSIEPSATPSTRPKTTR